MISLFFLDVISKIFKVLGSMLINIFKNFDEVALEFDLNYIGCATFLLRDLCDTIFVLNVVFAATILNQKLLSDAFEFDAKHFQSCSSHYCSQEWIEFVQIVQGVNDKLIVTTGRCLSQMNRIVVRIEFVLVQWYIDGVTSNTIMSLWKCFSSTPISGARAGEVMIAI